MNCDEVKQLLQLYLDSELDARATLAAQRHLEGCPACAGLLEQYARLDQALRQAARAEAADNQRLRSQIVAALRRPTPAHPPRPAWLSGPMLRRAAVLIGVAVVAAVLLTRFGPGPLLSDKVYADAAADHDHHCTLDRLAMARSDPAELNALAVNYGLKRVPDLTALNFTEPRAKECMIDGRRMLHLVFQGADGRPLSVFAARGMADAGALTVRPQGNYQVAAMRQADVTVLLVSSMSDQEIREIARRLAQQL